MFRGKYSGKNIKNDDSGQALVRRDGIHIR
jgi:hypothetical protein